MSFESLIDKVHQAEQALEARERQTAADWRQCKASWRGLWTPPRLVVAGLVSGFIVGKAEAGKHVVKGSSALQMLSAVAGLFAGGSAQAAAGQASDAADSAQQTTAAVADSGMQAESSSPLPPPRVAERNLHTPEALRAAGLL